ncbi:unnamed protein product [Calicophoron daubneyi]|uniref:Uncharacterized protein n=1 Tax=Calicophoron daubneyi TaxID=300641 RepID=A0AAV2TNI6_CALDB
MNKTHSAKPSKFRSIRIDRSLQQEHEHRKRELQLLLVGLTQSGKNTLCKQLRIHYGDGFPQASRVELIPTVLANLADAVALVLDSMTTLRIEFADNTISELANHLIDCRPKDGFLSDYFLNCSTNPFSTDQENDKDSSKNGILDENLVIQPNSFSKDIIINSPQLNPRGLTDMDNILPCDTPKVVNTYPEQQTDDDSMCLQDTLLKILNSGGEVIPPSLMKKLELLAEPSIITELRNSLSDKSKLHSLIVQLFGDKFDGLKGDLVRDTPPPSPRSPPPSTFEDELLDCLVIRPACDLSDDTSTSSSTSVSNREQDNGSSDENSCEQPVTDGIVGELPTTPVGQNRMYLTRTSRTYDSNLARIPFRSSKYSRTRSVANCSISDLINQLKMDRGRPFQSSKIILKMITEQPEFQEAVKSKELVLKKLTYADSYFIRHVDRIIQEDYIPTLQDILVMRQPSKAVRETELHIGTINLRTIDLAEQGKYLHKHLHYFESVNTVLFLVSLSDCMRTALNSSAKNELEKTVELFETLLFSPHMFKKDFVVFLNKVDLLKKAIHEASLDIISSVDTEEVDSFINTVKQRLLASKNKTDAKGGRITFHVTCALDVDQMKVVLHDCLRGICDSNRKRYPFS